MFQRRNVAVIDIDGVICMTAPWGMNKLRESLGLPGRIPHPKSWGWDEMEDRELREWGLQQFDNPRLYEFSQPFPFASSALWRIGTGFDLVYMTARGVDKQTGIVDNTIADTTRHWLHKWAFPEGELRFVHGGDKLEAVRWLYPNRLGFIVEDNLPTAEQFAQVGEQVYLIDAGYNRNVSSNGLYEHTGLIRRVVDMHDVYVTLTREGVLAVDAAA